MSKFESAYKKLNDQQKLAVDTIEGPVMVIAGPGTGKTQLLSVRASNILKVSDVSPNNILCLTFTDAAANEMRERLVDLIGQPGYDINVMTFHAFGSEIIGRWPEFFYNGAHMQAIDETNSYSILHDIFSTLKHSNPLSVQFSDEFTYLRDTQSAIGQLKKAAINPENLRSIVKNNIDFIEQNEQKIIDAFGEERISKKTIPRLEKLIENNVLKQEKDGLLSLKSIFLRDLEKALSSGKTPPVTEFKRRWLRKNSRGKLELKEKKNCKKLLALAGVYEKYQQRLAENRWFDYDDMVMQVVEELESNIQLRAELQEQFLYLMVDEFQDSNEAQLKLVRLLGDNPVNEGRPNVLVVGDDDQAIYKFQGADVTNMHQFIEWTKEPAVIPLRNIYRYPSKLLDVSRSVIGSVESSIENTIKGVDKDLEAVFDHSFDYSWQEYENESAELSALASKIKDKIDSGVEASSIAVIARQHSHLEHFSAYAQEFSIPISYDRKDNILDVGIIKELIHFSKTVLAIAGGNQKMVDGYLPELLSYRFWGVEPKELWDLNTSARKNKQSWLDAMQSSDVFKPIANKLLEISQSAIVDPLNYVLDQMIGAPLPGDIEHEDNYRSPFYDYYFKTKDGSISHEYIYLLSNLKTLKQHLRQYAKPGDKLAELINFVDIQNKAGFRITSNSKINQASDAVSLISAHKAKGLEFDYVYIIHASDNIWGSKKRARASLIKFPENLHIAPAGDSDDDRARLFYVAITRARKELHLSSSAYMENKKTLELRLIEDLIDKEEVSLSAQELDRSFITDWTPRHFEHAINQKSILQPYLDNYKLSISHLQSYVDVIQGGPSYWMINSLLKFPGAVIPPAAYGSAFHGAINDAQKFLSKNGQHKSTKLIIKDFNDYLEQMDLNEKDYKFYKERGEEFLEKYIDNRYKTFNKDDKSEVNFYNDNIIIEGAKITGLIDRLNIEEGNWTKGNVSISDLKTGKSATSWRGKSDFEKIKLYRYRQQLLFYEIMFENSHRFKNMSLNKSFLEFVECDEHGVINSLVLNATEEEKTRLKQLIKAVWNNMMDLSSPEVSVYPKKLEGIIAFENDLISANT